MSQVQATPQAAPATPALVNGKETPEQTIARLTRENAELRAQGTHQRDPNALSFKVGEKGGLSMYGLGRFPVTLYKSQWMRLIDAAKSGRIEEAITQFGTALKEKPVKE